MYILTLDNKTDLSIKDTRELRRQEEAKIGMREKLLTILCAFFLGLMFDYLFYGNSLGISYPVFNLFVIGFYINSARDKVGYRNKTGWLILAGIVLLSGNLAIHSNDFLSFLNFLAVPFLTVSYILIVTGVEEDWSRLAFLGHIMERVFILAVSNMFKPFKFIIEAIPRKIDDKKSATRKNIMIGLAAALLILIIIVPLLASADMVFNYYISNIPNILDYITVSDDIIPRIIWILIVFSYVFGFAWSLKFHSHKNTAVSKQRQGMVDPVIIITVLVVINLVYLFFTIIQFSYLYGSNGSPLPIGFTYAEYARRGFFELVTVTVINFLILLSSMKIMKQGSAGIGKAVRIFLSLLVAFTFNMLFSSHYKLSLYEESFGFTTLRIYVHMFMLFMCILFIIALVRIWNEKVLLFKASLITAILIFIILNYMNVDSIIARRNIERYQRTGNIDISYLGCLSYDAVPEIIKLTDDQDSKVALDTRDILRRKYDSLKREYKWMEYNLSRNRARNLLKEYFKQ